MPKGIPRQRGDKRVGEEEGGNGSENGMGRRTGGKGLMKVTKGGRELDVQRRKVENEAERASDSSAIGRKPGYVSLVSIPASLSAIHSMLEEGGEMGIAEGGLHLSESTIYPVTHSKVAEGGKKGYAEEGVVLNRAEVCMIRKCEDQNNGLPWCYRSRAKGQPEEVKHAIWVGDRTTEGPPMSRPREERPGSIQTNGRNLSGEGKPSDRDMQAVGVSVIYDKLTFDVHHWKQAVVEGKMAQLGIGRGRGGRGR